MTSPTTIREPRRWSRQRWAWTIGAVLLIHLATIRFLSARPTAARPATKALEPIRLLRQPAEPEAKDFSATLDDPTLFALPHRENVSGAAWLESKPISFRVTNSVEHPRWLLAEAIEILKAPLHAEVEPAMSTLTKLAPSLYDPALGPAPIRVRTQLSISSPLDRWVISSPEELPQPTSASTTAKDCVIQVLLLGAGPPFSATILEPSASPELDQKCLAFAKASRFALPPGAGSAATTLAEPLFGTLVFRWRLATQ